MVMAPQCRLLTIKVFFSMTVFGNIYLNVGLGDIIASQYDSPEIVFAISVVYLSTTTNLKVKNLHSKT